MTPLNPPHCQVASSVTTVHIGLGKESAFVQSKTPEWLSHCSHAMDLGKRMAGAPATVPSMSLRNVLVIIMICTNSYSTLGVTKCMRHVCLMGGFYD